MTSGGPFQAKLLCDSTDIIEIHIFNCSVLQKLNTLLKIPNQYIFVWHTKENTHCVKEHTTDHLGN